MNNNRVLLSVGGAVVVVLSAALLCSARNREEEESLLLESSSTFLLTLVISFALISTPIFVGLKFRSWCTCHVCYTYATAGWSPEFDNLCDWLACLLRDSPTRTVCVHVAGMIVTANKANVEHMLRTKFENYPKGKQFSEILGDLLGRGIFNVDGERWLIQRKLASLEMGSVSVRSYAFGIVREEVEERLLPLLDAVAADGNRGEGGGGGENRRGVGVVDLQDVFRRFSFDTICKISFGIDPGCLRLSLPISRFAAAFDAATMYSAERGTCLSPAVWKVKRLLNIGSEKKLRNALHLVNVLADEVIRQRRQELATSLTSRHDLLSRFIGSVADDGYLRDIVISFLLAGRDTVAATLTSFFYLLSNHPEEEARVLADIAGGVSSPPAPAITCEKLKEMHYVHAALYESMRLYPAVQMDSKFAAADDVLPDGTFVGKGTRVSFNPYAMGRLPEAWGEDYMKFRPARWLVGGVFQPESPFKYSVFQAGHRMCIGKDLAVMEMKTVIVSIVRSFKVTAVHPDRPLKFVAGLTANLRDGLPATVRRRNRHA